MSELDLIELRKKAKAATPGPWSVDGPLWNQIVWSSAENRVCFLAHSAGLDDARDAATGAFIAAANPSTVLALIDRVEKAEALIAKAGKPAPVYKAVEKILDEHSAWIARPDRKVTEAVALAAVIAADIETGASHVLGALHKRCDAAEDEISRLRALLARAGEALKPFHLLAPGEARDWTDEHGWTDLAPKNDRICDWFGPTDFSFARTVSAEIEKEIGNG